MCRAFAFVLAIALVAGIGTEAHGQDDLTIHRSPVTGLATFVTASDGGAISLQARPNQAPPRPVDFLQQRGRLFGISDPARQLRQSKVEVGLQQQIHTTYQQYHRGVRVFGGILKVHQNARRQVVAANGDFFPISPKLVTVPAVRPERAVGAAVQALAGANPIVQETELVIVDPGWYGDPPTGPRLAYYVVVTDLPAGIAEAFFVDARTGEIMDRWSLIHTARNREIHDAAGTATLPGPTARLEGQAATGDADVDAAYDYYGDTYDYFFRAFGRDGIDDAGLTMIATVDSTAPNCPNAFWSSFLLQMVFCAGTVTDDIVAHELTHGVTTFTANLIYQNQSGQLNESYSDVFGELVDLFNGDAAFAGPPGGSPWPVHPTGSGIDTPNNLRTACSPALAYPDGVRWLLGEDAVIFGGAIRDMWDPPCKGSPDFANSVLQTCYTTDNGGVHFGNGVTNHAFAMLVDGKIFNGFTVNGIGPIKAGAVWYRALTVYLTPFSDFQDAFIAFNQSASDLIGTFPSDPRTGLPSASQFVAADAVEVEKALLAVELNTPGACGAADFVVLPTQPTICAPGITVFFDDFESGVGAWTVSNSTPPTPYDWALTGAALPFGRSGVAWFVEDRNIGDCAAQDESALHSLISPTIALPLGADSPQLVFDHHVETEGGWDGGTLRIRVNGGLWQTISRSAFRFSPYNARLNTVVQGNTNPLAGEPGFSGEGGPWWGTSIVDLSGLAGASDNIQIRFDFGKDGCSGQGGWYVDDVEILVCPDCNSNAAPDRHEIHFVAASEPLSNIGAGVPQTFTLLSPPTATGNVRLAFTALADFSGIGFEAIAVNVNGVLIGSVFETGASDCPLTPDSAELTVSSEIFNAAVAGGDAAINLVALAAVSPTLCFGESYVTVLVEYDVGSLDCNANGVLDDCDVDALDPDGNGFVSADCQPDGTPDECQVIQAGALFDNGPLVTHPGAGAGGADVCQMQDNTLGITTLGFGAGLRFAGRVAEDLVISDSMGADIDTITFFAYQTGSSTASSIEAVVLQIWDGPPGDVGSNVIFGDLTTNRLARTGWSGIYRSSESNGLGSTLRPIMAMSVTVGATLAQGTYWLDWSATGTIISGPWAPPITSPGELTTGNGMIFGGAAWQPALDQGSNTQQGFPFIVFGEIAAECNGNGIPDLCEPVAYDVALFVAQVLSAAPDPILVCIFDGDDNGLLDGEDFQPFVTRLLNGP